MGVATGAVVVAAVVVTGVAAVVAAAAATTDSKPPWQQPRRRTLRRLCGWSGSRFAVSRAIHPSQVDKVGVDFTFFLFSPLLFRSVLPFPLPSLCGGVLALSLGRTNQFVNISFF